MNSYVQQQSLAARRAIHTRDWAGVKTCAREILGRERDSAEGHFLLGLAEKAANRNEQAEKAFSRAIHHDSSRYDAAIELAGQYMRSNKCGMAVAIVQEYELRIDNSPLYLEMAGTIYTDAGLPGKGWPLYRRAVELQAGVESLQAKFAACNVYVGKITDAQEIYSELLQRAPDHQRNHYELSRLSTATDRSHIEQMLAVLQSTNLRPEKNIYAYYALGKEFEDLECWEEAFQYYKLAGDAAASVSNYRVQSDIDAIDRTIEVCTADWIRDRVSEKRSADVAKTPIFVVGLPRTGTTLTERILSSHTMIETVGESYFMQSAIKELCRIGTKENMSATGIAEAVRKDIRRVATGYLRAIQYKFGDKPMFVEKFPENFLYLGFIAKAFPDAKIVHLLRNPMDTCFALYKQSFFRYAYSLDDLGEYYVAYQRLLEHWRRVLNDRLIEVHYEALVNDQVAQTRALLHEVGVSWEPGCLNFESNTSGSNTASTVQIREKIHNRSVEKWRRFEEQLRPLQDFLMSAGIETEKGAITGD